MKLWVDDVRVPPQSFDQWVTTASAAIALLKEGVGNEDILGP